MKIKKLIHSFYCCTITSSICFLVSSCCVVKTVKPTLVIDPVNVPQPDPSYINFKACLSSNDFLLAVKQNIENPIVKDDKPFKVVAEILATEDITFQSLVEVLVKPYKPGEWVPVVVKTYQTVRETFGCFIKPWKWGSCWRDVLKEVWVTTQKWIEPQLAVYEWQTVAVTKVIDKIFSPEATIHYPTYLDDIKISFSGNKFTIVGYTTTAVKVDVESKLLPLTPEIKLKSLLGLDINCEVTIEGEISITDDKQIAVSLNVPIFGIKTPVDKLPRIGGKDFYQYLFTDIGLAKLSEKIVEEIGKKSLQSALAKMLEKNNENFDFKKRIEFVTQVLSSPKELSKDIWLNMNPIEISCSQPKGTASDLCIEIGLKFEPNISYTSTAPTINPSNVSFKVQSSAPPVTNINLVLSASLNKLANIITESLNKELETNSNSIINKLYVKNVDVYKTNGNKTVVLLEVFSKAKLFKCKVFTAYLISDLLYDDVIKQFSLKNVNFDVNTRSSLLNSIYKAFIDKKIEQTIENNAVFNIESNFRKANELIANLSYVTDYGTLKGDATLNRLSGPYITNSSINMVAELRGDYLFDVTYKQPEKYSAKYLPGNTYENLDFRNKTLDGKLFYNRNDAQFNPQIGKLLDDSAYENLKKLLVFNKKFRQDFSKYNRIDFVQPTEVYKVPLNLLPFRESNIQFKKSTNSDDEFIYVIDEKGNRIKKRKSFEDQILPGEVYIYIDENGEIRQSINN